MKKLGLRFENIDKIKPYKMQLSPDAIESLGLNKKGVHPDEFIIKYLGDKKLFDNIQKEWANHVNKTLPKHVEENCLWCNKKSTNEEDKKCDPYHLEAGVNYFLAAIEYVRIVQSNKRLIKGEGILKSLTFKFFECFMFSDGRVIFDLEMLTMYCLKAGFLTLSQIFSNNSALQTLSIINEAIDNLKSERLNFDMFEKTKPYHIKPQLDFFKNKKKYFKNKYSIEKESNKKSENSRKLKICSEIIGLTGKENNPNTVQPVTHYIKDVLKKYNLTPIQAKEILNDLHGAYSPNWNKNVISEIIKYLENITDIKSNPIDAYDPNELFDDIKDNGFPISTSKLYNQIQLITDNFDKIKLKLLQDDLKFKIEEYELLKKIDSNDITESDRLTSILERFNNLDQFIDDIISIKQPNNIEKRTKLEQLKNTDLLKKIWLAESKLTIRDFLRKGIDNGIWDENLNLLVKRKSIYGSGKTLLGSLSVALRSYSINSNTDYKVVGNAFCQTFNISIKANTSDPYKSFQTGNGKYIKEIKRAFNIM